MSPEKAKFLLLGSIACTLLGISLIFYSTMSGNTSNNQSEPVPSVDPKPPRPKPKPSPAPGPGPGPLASPKSEYKLIMHEKAVKRIEDYKKQLEADIKISGNGLRQKLGKLFKGRAVKNLSTSEFIELLLATKWPLKYAEQLSYDSTSEWSPEDARVLGDIGVAIPVKVFDNGHWYTPKFHKPPLDAYLLYLPGALLVESCNVDYPEVFDGDKFNIIKYYELYERRLLPMLRFANDEAMAKGKKAVVTVPGMGCGEFAGNKLKNNLTNHFNNVLKELLTKHHSKLPNISLVYFAEHAPGDSFSESFDYKGLKYRHMKTGHVDYKNLLERPEDYQIEAGENYSNHILFAFVAWDHVSLPGNDFFAFSRNTDDGVKAAATSSMTSLLGVEGEYNSAKKKYLPKRKNLGTWEKIASEFRLEPTEGRLQVLKTKNNNEIVLSKYE